MPAANRGGGRNPRHPLTPGDHETEDLVMWCVICGYQKHDGQCCVGCVEHTEDGQCVTRDELLLEALQAAW